MKKEIAEKIELLQGDITRINSDAIVNAANASLLGGGGVDGAIHKAAGPELLAECKTIGGCPTGEARITKAYQLPAEYVIHTVGPVYHQYSKSEARRLLTSCYSNCFKLAADHRVATISFPAVSCGVYGYPIEEAGQVAIDTAITFINDNKLLRKIRFVLFSPGDLAAYGKYLETK